MTLAHKRLSFLVSVGLLYWVSFGGTFGGALSWRRQLSGHLFLFAISLLAAWKLLRRQANVRLSVLPTALNIALGLVILDKLCRALMGQSWDSTGDLAASAALLFLFYLVLNVAGDPAVLAAGCVLATVVGTMIGMALAYFQNQPELALPLGNRVLMAGLLTLVTPIAIARIQEVRHEKFRQILWSVGAAILIIGILQTRSSAALALLPLILLWSFTSGLRAGPRIALSAAVAVLIFFGANRLADYSEPLGRIKEIALHGKDWNLENRLRFWMGAMPAIQQKMLYGWGAGSVGVTYPPYRIQSPGLAPPGEVLTDLHSVPLSWLFEFGLVGLVVRLAALGGFLVMGFSRKSPLQKASVLALASYALYSQVHYQLNNSAIAVIATLVAVMAAPRANSWELSPRASSVAGLLLLGSAAIVFSYQFRQDYAHYLLARSSAEPERKAVDSVLRASLLDPRGGFYDAVAALRIDRLLAAAPKDSKDAPFLFEAAGRHYQRSFEENPWEPHLLAARGTLLLRSGRICDAIDPLEKAVSLDFFFSLAHFNLANAYAACGFTEQANTEAAVTLMTTPVIAYATQWRADPEFLTQAVDQSLTWMSSWNWRAQHGDNERLNRLESFLRKVREAPLRGHRLVSLTVVDNVADQLITDPFAYLFHRRMPAFTPTRIEADGLDSGTWAPEGIGRILGLRSLTYPEIHAQYKQGKLDGLMRSLKW